MRSASLLALSAAALVMVAACSSGSASTPGASATASAASAAPSGAASTPTAEELAGRVFIVTAAEGHELVPGSEIRLTFEQGRIGVSAGCNQMSGAFEIRDGALVVGPMMSTEMACEEPLMAQDQWIAAFLPRAAVTLQGDTLTLAKDGITVTAADTAVVTPDFPLEGTTWLVDGLLDNQAVSSMPAGVEATLEFGDGRVAVDAGCNTGAGSATIGDGTIVFGPIATTRMACTGDAMGVEARILGVLQGEVAFAIDGDALTITGASGGLTATGTAAGS